jgi:hypothetical protein
MNYLHPSWCLLRCALAFALFASLGCSSGTSLHKVAGKISVDGSPLAKGSVRFVPDKNKGNSGEAEPVGQIAADGTYTLVTNGKTGAPLGWYKVSIDVTEAGDSSHPRYVKSLINPRFHSPETSQLSIEVVASPATGAYDLNVSAH